MAEGKAQTDLWHGALSRRAFLTRTAGAGIAIGGLGAFGLAGCGKAGSGGGTTKNGKYTGQQAVTHLDDILSPAPFHVAEREGYFRDAGLMLKSVGFPGGSDVIRAIQSTSKLGAGSAIAALIAHDKGLKDVRFVGGLLNRSEVVFMAPASSPIKRPEDLNGKKIGVSEPGSNSTYFANLMIQRYKLQGAKVVSVGGPPDAMTAAEHGVVDIGWGAPPFSTKLEAQGKARVVVDTADLEPHWASTGLLTLKSFADANPDVVRKWIGALGKAIDLIHSDPERAGRAWAESVQGDPKVSAMALAEYKDAFTLQIDRASLEAGARAARSLGQLKGNPNLDEIIDERFLP
jgi:NitT/TauT family transport system substrate-binding protein